MKKVRLAVFVFYLVTFTPVLYAASGEYAPGISSCADIDNLKNEYFKDNRYNEFFDFLNSRKDKDKLAAGCVDYYKALTRYTQLKYLEEKQLWDDYFAEGNNYRDQILEGASKAAGEADAANPIKLKSRLLLWKFYRDQQNTFGEQGLEELISDLNAYAASADDPELIKDVADQLLASEEKAGARSVYKIYVDKLASGKISDGELKEVGAGFYKDGNLDLAETVYDIYIERIFKSMPVEKLVPELFGIAGIFVCKAQGLYDMAYAEKIYARIDGLGQKDIFNQDTIYLRAFNLEKLRDYKAAAGLYSQLIQVYPDSKHFDEAVYKIAMINAYALGDISKAREGFEKLCTKAEFSPQVISSFYQLGLLAQWEGDFPKAKGYYDAMLKNAGDKYMQLTARAKDRLKEAEAGKPLDYNLKVFLDTLLKNGKVPVEMGRSDLKVSGFILERGQKAGISVSANMPESGCNQVQVQYLWSGSLGGAVPSATEAGIEAAYPDAGIQEINLVIVSPAGITDIAFIMVDVY